MKIRGFKKMLRMAKMNDFLEEAKELGLKPEEYAIIVLRAIRPFARRAIAVRTGVAAQVMGGSE